MKKIFFNMLPNKLVNTLRKNTNQSHMEKLKKEISLPSPSASLIEQLEKEMSGLSPSELLNKWGHRKYIGGEDPESWYGIGKRQYHFLVANGLQSSHSFLDVACGSLRLGQYLIPMLDEGNYHGLEAEKGLIEAGLKNEILFDLVEKQKPRFASNYEFDLSFCSGYDFAIAQSLFTHLIIDDIEKCFKAMTKVAKKGSKFFFTFHEGDESENKFDVSHAHRNWKYRFETLEAVANKSGFDCQYIGDWGHERNQMIAIAIPKPISDNM